MQTATAYGDTEPTQPRGTLEPILLDAVGQPVVAVWVSDSGDQRWYLVPDQTDWDSMLEWLTTQALPEFAPAILRRLRSPLLQDPDLWTRAESAAHDALRALEDEYERRRADLQEQLDEAQAQADPIRDGLLYGTAKDLERAVANVLTDAGIKVADVDSLLGDTSSADLLAELDTQRRLIEVKSASGNAGEKLMGQLENHLRNWPPPGQGPVDGGVLIVNHQHRLPPAERSHAVYDRPDFLRNLAAPVISSRELYEWWRSAAWDQIRSAVFPSTAAATATVAAPPVAEPTPPEGGRRPRWRRS